MIVTNLSTVSCVTTAMLHLDHHWNAPPQTLNTDSSPTDPHSSPLSPVPDLPPPATPSATPALPTLQHLNPHMALAEEKEAPLEIPQREEEEEDDSAVSPTLQFQSSSRQSTPLSELSPPPDDDVPDTPNSSHPANPSLNGRPASHDGGGRDPRIVDRHPAEKSPMSATTATNNALTSANISRNGNNPSFDPLVTSLSFTVNGDAYAAAPPPSPWANMYLSNSSARSPTHPSFLAQSQHDLLSSTPSGSQDMRTAAVLELNVDLLRFVASFPPLGHKKSIHFPIAQNLHVSPKQRFCEYRSALSIVNIYIYPFPIDPPI